MDVLPVTLSTPALTESHPTSFSPAFSSFVLLPSFSSCFTYSCEFPSQFPHTLQYPVLQILSIMLRLFLCSLCFMCPFASFISVLVMGCFAPTFLFRSFAFPHTMMSSLRADCSQSCWKQFAIQCGCHFKEDKISTMVTNSVRQGKAFKSMQGLGICECCS